VSGATWRDRSTREERVDLGGPARPADRQRFSRPPGGRLSAALDAVGAQRKIVDNFPGQCALAGRSLVLAQHAEEFGRRYPVAPADPEHAHRQPVPSRQLQDRRPLLAEHQLDDRPDRNRRVLRRIRDEAGPARTYGTTAMRAAPAVDLGVVALRTRFPDCSGLVGGRAGSFSDSDVGSFMADLGNTRPLTDSSTVSTSTGRPQPVRSPLRLSVTSWSARQQIVGCGRNRNHGQVKDQHRMPDTPRAWQSDQSGRTEAGRQPPVTAAIHFPDVVDATGSTAIPYGVLDDYRLSPETRLVYVMLRRLATTSPGRPIDQHDLARSIGIPTHRLARHLTLLARNGHIQVRSEWPRDVRTAVRYRLVEPTRDETGVPARTLTMTYQSQRRRATSGSAGLRLTDRLIVMGVDPQVAGCLVASYPKERVAGALRAAHRRRPRPGDPARGWSRRSGTAGSPRTPPSPLASARLPRSRRSSRGSNAPTPPCQHCQPRPSTPCAAEPPRSSRAGSASVWPPPGSAPCW
jgi:hypothetical protein